MLLACMGVQAADWQSVYTNIPGLDLAVDMDTVKSINDDDARLEGFDSVDDLKNALLTIYRDYWLDEYSRVYYYRFECLGKRDVCR